MAFVLGVAAIASVFRQGDYLFLPFVVCIIAFPLWALGAAFAARRGLFVYPIYWPLLPFAPVLAAIHHVRKEGPVYSNFWTKFQWLDTTPIFLGLLLMLLYTVSPSIVAIIVLVIFLVAVVPLGTAMLSMVWKAAKDLMRYRKWRDSGQTIMTTDELLQLVASFRTRFFLLRVLRIVRVRGMLVAEKRAQAVLEELIGAVGRANTDVPAFARLIIGWTAAKTKRGPSAVGTPIGMQPAMPAPNALDASLAQYLGNNEFLSIFGSEGLDELSRLLETVRVRCSAEARPTPVA